MAGIRFRHRGSFQKTERFFKRMTQREYLKMLNKYGRIGVDALSSATPIDSGETAASWNYEIHQTGGSATITWINNHTNKGVNIAIILQYGHGTGTGGYVQGRDYINPAIRPIFDKIAEDAWKEVTRE